MSRTYGPWKFDARKLTLTHIKEDYEVNVTDMTNSAKMLDWIFQVSNKAWCSREDAGHLLDALDNLLDPQANLCSFGENKPFNPTQHLKKKR
jgi:hypothetical protein